MADPRRLHRLATIGMLATCTLLAACGSAPPMPAFQRAEVVATAAPSEACADACRPRGGEAVVACHLGSLESALVAHRDALGDSNVRRDATVCLYGRAR